MLSPATPFLDHQGAPMFQCAYCGNALSPDDIVAHNLRLPDRGESRDDYFEAELLDDLNHVDCVRAARAG